MTRLTMKRRRVRNRSHRSLRRSAASQGAGCAEWQMFVVVNLIFK
jgi:hypothetical protein